MGVAIIKLSINSYLDGHGVLIKFLGLWWYNPINIYTLELDLRFWAYHHSSCSKPFETLLEEIKHILYHVNCLFLGCSLLQWLELYTCRINDQIIWGVLEAPGFRSFISVFRLLLFIEIESSVCLFSFKDKKYIF